MRRSAVLSIVAISVAVVLGGCELLPVSAQAQGKVVGLVTDVDGKPIRGLGVRLVPEGAESDTVKPVKTNKRGRFLRSALRPGTYRFELDDPNRFVVRAEYSVRDWNGLSLGSGTIEGHPVRGLPAIPIPQQDFSIELIVGERGSEQDREISLRFASPALKESVELYERGDYGEAAETAGAVLAENPELGEALYVRGLSLWRLGELAESTQLLERASKSMPDHPGILGVLGQSRLEWADELRAAGSEDEAAANYLRAAEEFAGELERKPDARAALINRSVALERAGDEERLVPALEAVLAQVPDNVQAMAKLASLYSARGEHDRALELLQTIPATDKRVAVSLFNIAVRLFEEEQYEAALLAAGRAGEIDPDLAEVPRLAAQAHLARGDHPAAIAEMKKFLELAPEDPEADTYRQLIEALAQ